MFLQMFPFDHQAVSAFSLCSSMELKLILSVAMTTTTHSRDQVCWWIPDQTWEPEMRFSSFYINWAFIQLGQIGDVREKTFVLTAASLCCCLRLTGIRLCETKLRMHLERLTARSCTCTQAWGNLTYFSFQDSEDLCRFNNQLKLCDGIKDTSPRTIHDLFIWHFLQNLLKV